MEDYDSVFFLELSGGNNGFSAVCRQNQVTESPVLGVRCNFVYRQNQVTKSPVLGVRCNFVYLYRIKDESLFCGGWKIIYVQFSPGPSLFRRELSNFYLAPKITEAVSSTFMQT